MRKGHIILLGGLCAVLAGATVYLQLSEDRTAPVIQVPEEQIVYNSLDPYEILLEQVTAADDVDGDVTDTLLVEKVYPSEDKTTATVIYVARDKSNNIGKAKRVVTYVDSSAETSIAEELQSDLESETSAESENGGLDSVDTAQEQSVPAANTDENMDAQSDTNTDLAALENLPEGSPIITLKETEITITKGESVNRILYVDTITDDKDDKNTLWQNIQIAGDSFDNNTAGSYEQIYYVVDSDGNRSNEARLVIHVQ